MSFSVPINKDVRSQEAHSLRTVGSSIVLRDGEEKALAVSMFSAPRRIWRNSAEKQALQIRMPAALLPIASFTGGHAAYGDTCVAPQPEGSP